MGGKGGGGRGTGEGDGFSSHSCSLPSGSEVRQNTLYPRNNRGPGRVGGCFELLPRIALESKRAVPCVLGVHAATLP